MPLTLRATKGSPLTSAEGDANIKTLDDRLKVLELHNIIPGLYWVGDFLPAGSTTVTSAVIQSALDAMPATGGELIYPSYNYNLTSQINVAKPVHSRGLNAGDPYNNIGPTRLLGARNINVFNITVPGTKWSDLHFQCIDTATVTPTSGTALYNNIQKEVPGHDNPAITTTGDHKIYFGTISGSTRIDSCTFWGFYDNVYMRNAMEWWVTNSHFAAMVRHGLFVDNESLPDGGDGKVLGCNFYPELRDCRTGIYQVAAGGLQVSGTKQNGRAYYRMDYFYKGVVTSQTSDLLFEGPNSLENFRYGGIHLRGDGGVGFKNIIFNGIQFAAYSPDLVSNIDVAGCRKITSGMHVFDNEASTVASTGYNTRIDNCKGVTLVGSTHDEANVPRNLITNSTGVRDLDTMPTVTELNESTFSDDFTDGPLSLRRWSEYSQGVGKMTLNNNLTMQPGRFGGSGTESNRAMWRSTKTYDARGKSIVVNLSSVGNAGDPGASAFFLSVGSGNRLDHQNVAMAVQGNILYGQYGDAAGGSGSVAFNIAATKYLRVQFGSDGSTFQTAYSADGTTYTNLFGGATVNNMANAYVYLYAAESDQVSNHAPTILSLVRLT